ncbi:unnamed protein product [Ceratitis capitata]|uniref:(Mediterranean fruit fly) hypothetical protein n=1 Tax=Ceratitis capitata TaxID=7213 RepID=A0A811V0C6_CERCA|nr:unnamed protein product [Ceratitis capitata]
MNAHSNDIVITIFVTNKFNTFTKSPSDCVSIVLLPLLQVDLAASPLSTHSLVRQVTISRASNTYNHCGIPTLLDQARSDDAHDIIAHTSGYIHIRMYTCINIFVCLM